MSVQSYYPTSNVKAAKILLIFFLFLCGPSLLSIKTTIPLVEAAGGLWLEGWAYRKSILITGSVGAGAGYQVQINVYYSSGESSGQNVYVNEKCQTDFDDIRFTDNDGVTVLSYWLWKKTDSDNAKFWAKVLDDLDYDQTIYVYYGNDEAASLSNMARTFVVADNFDDNSLNTTMWGTIASSSDGAYLGESGGKLVAYTSGSSDWWDSVNKSPRIYAPLDITKNYMVDVWVSSYANHPSKTMSITGFAEDPTIQSSNILCVARGDNGVGEGTMYERFGTPGTIRSNAINPTYYQFKKIGDIYTFYTATSDDGSFTQEGTIEIVFTALFVFVASKSWTGNVIYSYFDDIRVRNYVEPEPVPTTIGSEEIPNVAPTNDSLTLNLTGANYKSTKTLLAAKQDYPFVYVCSDGDGVEDLTYAEIRLDYTSKNIILRATRGSGDVWTFSEQSDTNDYVTLNTGGSTHSTSGTQKTFTFLVTINWNWDDSGETLGVRAYVIDSNLESDQDDYSNIFGIENDLVFSSLVVDDDRVNPAQTITFSGKLYYEDTSINPPDGNYQVIVKLSGIQKGSTDTTLVSGTFSINVVAELVVGPYSYTVEASYMVSAGIFSTVIVDRLQVQSYALSVPHAYVGDNIDIDVLVWFDYDDTVCTTATITINGQPATHLGSGVYRITRTSETPATGVYDLVGCSAESTYGITTVDQNGKSASNGWILPPISTPATTAVTVIASMFILFSVMVGFSAITRGFKVGGASGVTNEIIEYILLITIFAIAVVIFTDMGW